MLCCGSMSLLSLNRLVPSHVASFEAYVPSKPDSELMKLYGCRFLHRLNNNENPLGPPPLARQALKQFDPADAAIYPSGDSYYLRLALAERHGLAPDQVLMGNGANEVIAFVVKAFCEGGDNVITADRTFAVYEWVARFSGVEPRLVPLLNHEFDDEAMLAQVDERTKVVFLCNPNNPTGTYWSHERLRNFMLRLGDQAIMVVDEAYCEFVEAADFPDSLSLLKEFPHLVIFRTFSKMYGLAALRVGYLLGSPEVVGVVQRTCVAYSVSSLGQVAALAALQDDQHHLEKTRALVRSSKDFLVRSLAELGLEVVVGEGPFISCRLPGSDTLAYRKMMQEGYMIRPMTGFRFPGYVRITLSHGEIMEGLVKALERMLHGNRS